MTRLAPILLVGLLVVGCSGSQSGPPVSKLPAFHGQTRAQITARLGEPQRDDKFPMSEAYGEFRIELQNTYPLSNPADEKVEIEEMTWQDGGYWVTLWLHQVNGQWVVLHSCRWRKDVAF